MLNNVSISIENFLKNIYLLEQNPGSDTRPGSLARALSISNAAATDMAKKLAERRLVDYEKYKALKLTDAGRKLALNVLRKHRLWETFLYRTFGLSLHEIHREAELLEHQTSEFLAEKISAYLNNPETDPHGDPIPNKAGKVDIEKGQINLSMAEAGRHYKITRLFSSAKGFFDFCQNNGLDVGSSLKVETQYADQRMTEISISGSRIILNLELTEIIYVKPCETSKK
jgi:DtxR family Mn-dependent transcriptional regulator